MILARKLQSAIRLYRRGGLSNVADMAWDQSLAFARANAIVPQTAGRRAVLMRRVFGNLSEQSYVAFDAADAGAVRPALLYPYLRRQFFDVIAASRAPGHFSPPEIMIVADSLLRRWDYAGLDTAMPAWREAVAGSKFAPVLDQMARRAALRLGRIADAADGLPRSGGDLADCLLRAEIFDAQGRVEEAARAFEEGLHRDVSAAGLRLQYAFHLLRRGRLLEGLESWGIADRVLETYPLRKRLRQWAGEDLEGRSLLVVFEHGLGDMVQMSRFLRPLRTRQPGAAVHGVVPGPLVGLMRQSFPDVSFTSTDDDEPPCDFYIPSLQLPLVIEALSLEPTQGYIRLGEARGRTGSGRKRVGICWRGHPRHYEVTRSIPLERFARLLSCDEVEFVVLLNQVTPEEDAILRRFPDVERPEIRNFVDLAAIIAGCDIVLSVDTAIPHVAAAGGRPVLLLSRPDTCWRWGPAGSPSPWYPEVEVLRHPGDMDWDAVLWSAGLRLVERLGLSRAAASVSEPRVHADRVE